MLLIFPNDIQELSLNSNCCPQQLVTSVKAIQIPVLQKLKYQKAGLVTHAAWTTCLPILCMRQCCHWHHTQMLAILSFSKAD